MEATVLKIVKETLGNDLGGCDSVSLRLNKLSPEFGKDDKKQEIENICKKFNDKTIDLQMPDVHFPNEVSVYAKLQSRLIVNQAGGNIENAGLCLHRFFGYPMIPGSAVKGAAHHAAWCEWTEIPEEDKEKRLEHIRKMSRVFGYPLNDDDIKKFIDETAMDEFKDYVFKGSISFLPAIPYGDASDVKLEPDVVTSHHSKYYSSKETNAVAKDNEQPVPNFFPTVKAQATFKFTIVPSRNASDENIKLATQWLAKALTINGVGAKTAAGYGWFTDETENVISQQKRKEEAKILGEKISLIKEKISELESIDGTFSAEQSKLVDDLRSDAISIKAPQEIFDCLNRLASKKPLESYRTKICNLSEREFLNQCIYQFEKRKPQEKIDIVYSLREELIEIWRRLYSSTDKKIKLIVESIRKVNSTLNIGKMPK